MAEDRLRAAVAAGVLAAERAHDELLRSVVDVARSIFAARAASIAMLDEEAEELVFEAVSGEGEETLVGTRFPADEGVAGWVVSAGQPLVLDDVGGDPRFSRETAESTGYVPKALMAAPLMRGERALGALSVLDRDNEGSFDLGHIELLELFANQAALALDVVQRARAARRALEGGGELAALSRLTAALERAERPRRDAGLRLLGALEELLEEESPGGL